ncbi:hypothetical protein BX666DRAFT_1924895 [Dichotomocladium elegans]|nr:hypothetical protein BX666DRAFT_1924895 [Dichotomocladium elegans]
MITRKILFFFFTIINLGIFDRCYGFLAMIRIPIIVTWTYLSLEICSSTVYQPRLRVY